MDVRYVGPIDEVNIREFDIVVKRNHKVTVPDAIGRRLVEQSDWEEVGKPKSQQEETPPKAATSG